MSTSRPAFVSEPIVPEPGSGDADAMARGEPGAPHTFMWRDRHYEIADVLTTWRSHGMDRGDKYVKRHWFEVVTTGGDRMRIYCERHPRNPAQRWWIFSVIFGQLGSRTDGT